MAKAFRPSVSYRNQEGKLVSVLPSTYAEVKKRMREFMSDSIDNCVSVYRHRRGEWGEYYEKWQKQGNKNVIIKQGWQ